MIITRERFLKLMRSMPDTSEATPLIIHRVLYDKIASETPDHELLRSALRDASRPIPRRVRK